MKTILPTLALSFGIILLWGLWGFFGKLALMRAMPATSVFLAEVATGAAVGALALILFARSGAALPWRRRSTSGASSPASSRAAPCC